MARAPATVCARDLSVLCRWFALYLCHLRVEIRRHARLATRPLRDPFRPFRTIRSRATPLIVATALLMENIDSTVLATSLPQIAYDFGTSPILLKLALTSYLLALAIFIPASGWAADRFGARKVFRAAILVFAAGSIACAASTSLGSLIAARVFQGIGGSMMVPVGRLIVLRATPKAGLVGALA